MSNSLLKIMFLCFCFYSVSAQKKAQNSKSKYKLVWSDEFNYFGLPDSTKWGYDVGEGDWGWGNNEQQYYTKADTNNVFVKNGILTITAQKEKRGTKDYTSARLITKGKADWSHGRIDFRAKLPKGRGTWPAGWMLGSNISTVGWPLCGEVDVLEHVGYDPDTIVGSFHSTTYNHMKGTQKTQKLFIKDPYTSFHIYSCEWNDEEISFLLDGKAYLTVQNEKKTEKEWPFNKPLYALINLAIGGNWGGAKGIDPDIFPAKLEYDYVRVFQKR
jgi:beta-glucanase (GH16 family)